MKSADQEFIVNGGKDAVGDCVDKTSSALSKVRCEEVILFPIMFTLETWELGTWSKQELQRKFQVLVIKRSHTCRQGRKGQRKGI